MKSLQKGIQKFLITLVFISAIAQVISQPEEKISNIKNNYFHRTRYFRRIK